MLSRTSVSAGRVLRARQPHVQCRIPLRNRPTQFSSLPARRFQSTVSSSSTSSASGGSAFVGGLAGGSAVFLLGYIWYSFSGAKTIVNASSKTQKYLDTAKQKVASTAENLEPNEALKWLRSTALTYAAFIPGAKGYVNSAFDDLDKIRSKHGDEVDAAVRDAYGELKQVVTSKKSGMTYETARKVWDILARFADRVGELAGDAAQDILNNHPQLKEKLGGSVDQLKQMGDNYGPQVKEEVDKTWKQLSDVVKKGASGDMAEAANKAYKILQEKVETVRGMVDEAWQKGMEQAKPYLDKNPKIKKLIEDNKDALQQGDVSQLWETAKQAAESGDAGDLEKMVKDKVQQAKKSGGMLGKGADSLQGGLDKLLQAFPGGAEIAPKLQTLQQIADKRGKEAEQILKETIEEIQKVLKKKVGEAEEVADKAKKDAK